MSVFFTSLLLLLQLPGSSTLSPIPATLRRSAVLCGSAHSVAAVREEADLPNSAAQRLSGLVGRLSVLRENYLRDEAAASTLVTAACPLPAASAPWLLCALERGMAALVHLGVSGSAAAAWSSLPASSALHPVLALRYAMALTRLEPWEEGVPLLGRGLQVSVEEAAAEGSPAAAELEEAAPQPEQDLDTPPSAPEAAAEGSPAAAELQEAPQPEQDLDTPPSAPPPAATEQQLQETPLLPPESTEWNSIQASQDTDEAEAAAAGGAAAAAAAAAATPAPPTPLPRPLLELPVQPSAPLPEGAYPEYPEIPPGPHYALAVAGLVAGIPRDGLGGSTPPDPATAHAARQAFAGAMAAAAAAAAPPGMPPPPYTLNTTAIALARLQLEADRQALLALGVRAAASLPSYAQLLASQSDAQFARQEAIRRAFVHDWQAYRAAAWGRDVLRPLSGGGESDVCQLGETVVDALDTALLMGLAGPYQQGRDWLAGEAFSAALGGQGDINLFECTIRVVGGLLAAYDLSGDGVLLARAEGVARAMVEAGAFASPTGIPYGTLFLEERVWGERQGDGAKVMGPCVPRLSFEEADRLEKAAAEAAAAAAAADSDSDSTEGALSPTEEQGQQQLGSSQREGEEGEEGEEEEEAPPQLLPPRAVPSHAASGVRTPCGHAYNPNYNGGCSSASEIGTLQLEFTALTARCTEAALKAEAAGRAAAAAATAPAAAEPATAAVTVSSDGDLYSSTEQHHHHHQQQSQSQAALLAEAAAPVVFAPPTPPVGTYAYHTLGMAAQNALLRLGPVSGLFPIYLHPSNSAVLKDAPVTLGARGDSLYEYFLKEWLTLGGWRVERARAASLAALAVAVLQPSVAWEARGCGGGGGGLAAPSEERQEGEEAGPAPQTQTAAEAEAAGNALEALISGAIAAMGRAREDDPRPLLRAFNRAVTGITDRLVQHSTPGGLVYVAEQTRAVRVEEAAQSVPLSHKMDHLVCFLPGVLALGAVHGAGHEALARAREAAIRSNALAAALLQAMPGVFGGGGQWQWQWQ